MVLELWHHSISTVSYNRHLPSQRAARSARNSEMTSARALGSLSVFCKNVGVDWESNSKIIQAQNAIVVVRVK